MERWPIDRTWLTSGENGNRESVATSDLLRAQSCCMLGTAGSGKTIEMLVLKDLEAKTKKVTYKRLVEIGTDATGLRTGLEQLSSEATSQSAIYLDALDEAVVPVRTAGLIVANWIRQRLKNTEIS